jgi:hypothetical protein
MHVLLCLCHDGLLWLFLLAVCVCCEEGQEVQEQELQDCLQDCKLYAGRTMSQWRSGACIHGMCLLPGAVLLFSCCGVWCLGGSCMSTTCVHVYNDSRTTTAAVWCCAAASIAMQAAAALQVGTHQRRSGVSAPRLWLLHHRNAAPAALAGQCCRGLF